MASTAKQLKSLDKGLSWPKFISAYKKAFGKTTHEELSSLWVKYKELNGISPKTSPKAAPAKKTSVKAAEKKPAAKKVSPKVSPVKKAKKIPIVEEVVTVEKKSKKPAAKKVSPVTKIPIVEEPVAKKSKKKPAAKKVSPKPSPKVSPVKKTKKAKAAEEPLVTIVPIEKKSKKKVTGKPKAPPQKVASKVASKAPPPPKVASKAASKAVLELVPLSKSKKANKVLEKAASAYLVTPAIKPKNAFSLYPPPSEIPRTWLIMELPLAVYDGKKNTPYILTSDNDKGLIEYLKSFTTNNEDDLSYNISFFEVVDSVLRLYIYIVDIDADSAEAVRKNIDDGIFASDAVIDEIDEGRLVIQETPSTLESKSLPPVKSNAIPTAYSKDNFQSTLDAIEKNEFDATTFLDLIQATGLFNAHFSSPTYGKSVIVYVPNNEAFDNLPDSVLEYLRTHPKELARVLRNHVIWQYWENANVAETVDGNKVKKERDGTTYGDAQVIKEGTNGSYYLIDKVIVPNDLVVPLPKKKPLSPPKSPVNEVKSPPSQRNNTPNDVNDQDLLPALAYFLQPALVPSEGYGVYGDTFYESDLPEQWFVVRIPLLNGDEPYHDAIPDSDVNSITDYIRDLRREEHADQFNILFWDWNANDGVIRLYCVLYEGSDPIQVRNEIYAAIDEDPYIFDEVRFAINQEIFDANLGKPLNLDEEQGETGDYSFGDTTKEEPEYQMPDVSARQHERQQTPPEASELSLPEREVRFTNKKGIHCPSCVLVAPNNREKSIEGALVITLPLNESPSLGNKKVVPITRELSSYELKQVEAAMRAINGKITGDFYIQYFSYVPKNNYVKLYIQASDDLDVNDLHDELRNVTNQRPVASDGRRAVRLGEEE